MTPHKSVIKCGKFAVLVDFHVMSQDSNEYPGWFSDHKRKEVCMLLKDAIDSRVKQYLVAPKCHGQWKEAEYAEANPLSLRASDFHVAAYFVRRWVNLRCIGGQQNSELRVFPERFVICVTRFESSPPPRVSESVAPKVSQSAGTSEYFGESVEDENCKTSLTQQKKQDILKKIVKRTKTAKANESKPQPSKDTMKVYLGSLCSDRE